MVLPTNGTLRASDINAALFFTAGNVGVNTTNPSQLIDANGTLKTSTLIATGNSNTLGSIITTNGNVGINTASPSHTLEVITTNTLGNVSLGTNVQNRKLVLWDGLTGEHEFFGLGINDSVLRYQIDNTVSFHKFYAGTSATSSNCAMTIAGNGLVGIGTESPGEKLAINGNLRVGNSTQSNYIVFNGTYGDDGLTKTYIGERIYESGTEKSELLLFKGNDSDSTNGPDRIRFLAPEHRFDMGYFTTGQFDAIGSSGNATNTITITSKGNIGINTTDPGSVLLNIDGMSAQYATGLRIDESAHATSNRQAIFQGDWYIGQDLDGNGTRDFWLYQESTTSTRFYLNTSGFLGLGVKPPLSRLHVKSTTTNDGGNLNADSNATICFDAYGQTYWLLSQDSYQTLIFSNGTTARGYFSNSTQVANIDFTGQHRCESQSIPEDISTMIGYIVKSTGIYNNLNESNEPNINESLPEVVLTDSAYDIAVYGVISDREESSTHRKYETGAFVSIMQKSEDDNRLIINSLGEGAIWVCNANGNIENGDYITSSQVPGIGMRQESEYMFNYTVAKATCSMDFGNVPTSFQKRYLQSNGTIINENEYNQIKTSGGDAYISVLIGCTYHCG